MTIVIRPKDRRRNKCRGSLREPTLDRGAIHDTILWRSSQILPVVFMLVVLLALNMNSTWAQTQTPARVPDNRQFLTTLNDPITKSFQHDATLRSVAYISSDRVVAVGDRGTVLVSNDAGRTWRLSPTPVSANLHDVQFVGDVGYAVGGWIGSESGCSYATILRSNNAGETWEIVPSDSLPRLIGIRIIGNRIICWGDYSVQIGSCVFASDNGGLVWSAASSGLANATAAGVNASGEIAAVDQLGQAKLQSHDAVQTIGRPQWYFNVLFATNDKWFAAGENGELITSKDGRQWENVALPLTAEIQRLCTWKCIEQHGSTLWLAGLPGSIVYRSNDSGRTWESLRTGQNLPINKLRFIDPNRGWAVGPLGTILATRDGGSTWYAQRRQPERLCLLTIATGTDCIPWLAAAATVWDQRRTTAALALKHAEPIDRADAQPSHESVSKESAGRLGLAELQVCDTSSDDERAALRRLATHIVTWRPDVVLYASKTTKTLAEGSQEWSMAKAVELAGSSEFRELLMPLNLDSWNVSKLVTTTANGQGDYSEDAQRVLRDSGLTLRDVVSSLPKDDREAATELSMVTTWCRSHSRAGQANLLGGIAMPPETQITSKLQTMGNFQLVMGRVHRDRSLRQLIAADRELADSQQWLGQLRFFLPSVPARELPELFVNLTDGLLARQQWQNTELVLQQLMNADHGDTGLWAGARLLQLSSSNELRHWISSTTTESGRTAASGVRSASYQDTWSNTPFSTPDPLPNSFDVTSASTTDGAVGMVVSADTQQDSVDQSTIKLPLNPTATEWSNLAERAFKLHPRLRGDPASQMLLAKTLREAENVAGQRTVLSELALQSQLIGWSQSAKQELALLDHRESQLKWTVIASPANSLPKLDGKFDEPFWTAAAKMQLTSLKEHEHLPAEIAWAYDLEYLYLAIRCPNDNRKSVQPPARVRSYDANLEGLDHVELMIDVDRDYCSTIDLAVAENGLTYDRCMNLAGFNPKWHVKVVQEFDAWQAEVAIKLDTLVDELPQRGTRWAVSARRIRPAQSPQSWSQLKTHQRLPESAGLVLFE